LVDHAEAFLYFFFRIGLESLVFRAFFAGLSGTPADRFNALLAFELVDFSRLRDFEFATLILLFFFLDNFNLVFRVLAGTDFLPLDFTLEDGEEVLEEVHDESIEKVPFSNFLKGDVLAEPVGPGMVFFEILEESAEGFRRFFISGRILLANMSNANSFSLLFHISFNDFNFLSFICCGVATNSNSLGFVCFCFFPRIFSLSWSSVANAELFFGIFLSDSGKFLTSLKLDDGIFCFF